MPPSGPASTSSWPPSVRARSSISSKRGAPPLAGAVVGDDRLDAAVARFDHAQRDPRRGPAPDRLVHRVADDLVQADPRVLGQRVGGFHVDVHLDLVREPDLLRERLHRRPEPLVSQDDRLDVEREVAERADRVAVPRERRTQHLLGFVEPLRLDASR